MSPPRGLVYRARKALALLASCAVLAATLPLGAGLVAVFMAGELAVAAIDPDRRGITRSWARRFRRPGGEGAARAAGGEAADASPGGPWTGVRD